MQRTQIYLDKKTIRFLASLAQKTGKTRSQLIREALSRNYMQADVGKALGQVQGLKSFAQVNDKASDGSSLRQQRQW